MGFSNIGIINSNGSDAILLFVYVNLYFSFFHNATM